MTYTDENSDRICQWEDLATEERVTAARAMLETGKYITRVNGFWHKLEDQDLIQIKLVLIAEAKREHREKLTQTNVEICGTPNDQKTPRLTKLEKRRLKRAAWLDRWEHQLQWLRNYVHQKDRYGWTRPRACSEIAKWVGLPPYKVSRIAQKALQLGLIAKQGRHYVPKIGRPPKV
jgi:hypothetical protein